MSAAAHDPTPRPMTGVQETQAEFDARMAAGRRQRVERVAPERDPFRGLPQVNEEPW